ncbi:facilitated trehalose transporter Tret1 [Orussus abietinus]|uniref:facilitated trehalose transporter Tret1 n=1 Tax=Orussus abietinus TaxID=222816 RepID=UPI000625A857|nr:facilitated trehalose transporter Tret1 [Orussus abietinus]
MTEKGSKLLQFIAAATGNMCVVAGGAMMGWTSPILPKLVSSEVAADNPFGRPISDEEASWIGSLVPLGTVFGAIIAGYLAERLGRKKTLLLCTLPYTIGWILVGTATNIPQLYVARLISGIALAVPFTVLPMYVGEIAETSIRGVLGSFLQLFITIGFLFSYAIGPYVSYVVLCYSCATIPLIFFLCFLPMPESPYYLLSKGRKEDALQNLARLRGKTVQGVQKEADEMQAIVEEAFRNEASMADLFTVKANFKALLFTCALVAFQQFSGIDVMLFYTEEIFISAHSTIPSSISTIVIGVVQVAASVVTPFVVDRLGRRILLVFSGVGETITLGALGLFFYLMEVSKMDTSSISWLPIGCLMVFISTYSVGWGPLPWAVMGEMFASDVKSKASSITVCICWFIAFIITKFFSNVKVAFGSHTAFWIFGVCAALSVVFTIFLLPETKGKTLQQIQNELSGDLTEVPELNASTSSKQ